MMRLNFTRFSFIIVIRRFHPGSKTGGRRADAVIKVRLKDGSQQCICIYIHIEVQGEKDPDFVVRIYVYNYRIFDFYKDEGVEVISLAILTDEDPDWRPDEYVVKRGDFELRMKIPMVKIIDFKLKKEWREKLEKTDNPMAMVVKAQLKSFDAKKTGNQEKSDIQWELIRECYESGYSKEDIRILLNFVDYVIRVPRAFQKKLIERIIKYEEEHSMNYIASWERIAEQRGERKGERKGILKTARELIKKGVDLDIIVEATGFPREEIEKLAAKVH